MTAASGAAPALSVVVVILGGGRDYLTRCLGGLARQRDVAAPEIIVPHDESLTDLGTLQAEFPGAVFLGVPGRRTYAELRALGFRRARGEIVALTEDHCTPEPDWCANIQRLHAHPYAAVGGSVDKAGPDSVLNWAIYLCDFGRYMNPVPEGPSGYLTDCNVSYKRGKLADLAAVWADEFHETTVNWTLLSRRETLWLSPTVVVRQQRSLRLGPALRERYAFGRLFASTRVAATTPLKRIAYAAFALALPALLIARVTRQVIGKGRNVGRFVFALPLILLLDLVWTYGELAGYVTGRSAETLTPALPEPRGAS